MISLIKLPAKIIGILEANISPSEIAFGVCLGMFLGFTPLNGTTALLLTIFFFIFKVNRMATLLTLPAFKMVYLLGVNKLGDGVGSYLLERADYLTGFWRMLTNLPVVAYLDVNRTTVAGGLFLSAVLMVPVFFISRHIAKMMLEKYSGSIKNMAFMKWVKRAYKASDIIGPDVAATIGNVKATVKSTIVGKVKSLIIKPKAPKTGIMKRINLTGIIMVLAVLLVIQVGVGLIVSPAVSAFVIDSLNHTGGAKITVERINVWPLTLSCSLKELKAFDPSDPGKRILRVGSGSVRISPLALLSKKLVFSTINMRQAELDLEGAPDGSLNIQRLVSSKTTPQTTGGSQGAAALWRGAAEKRDWFGKIYSMIQKRFSNKGQEEAKKARAEAGKAKRVTQEIPGGKLVNFKTPADMYLFEIRKLSISGSVRIAPNNSQPIELKDARIGLRRVAFDPDNGLKFDGIKLRGAIYKNNAAAGSINLSYAKGHGSSGQTAKFALILNRVDLDAVRFVYEDSLPVHVVKGVVSLNSDTKITGQAIDSRNSITLTGQTLQAKAGSGAAVGFIPMGTVCDALNRIDPLQLKFTITGTVDKPEFGGFQEMLLSLAKPFIANIGEQVKSQGINVLGQLIQKNMGGVKGEATSSGTSNTDAAAKQAVESLKSLFGDKNKN